MKKFLTWVLLMGLLSTDLFAVGKRVLFVAECDVHNVTLYSYNRHGEFDWKAPLDFTNKRAGIHGNSLKNGETAAWFDLAGRTNKQKVKWNYYQLIETEYGRIKKVKMEKFVTIPNNIDEFVLDCNGGQIALNSPFYDGINYSKEKVHALNDSPRVQKIKRKIKNGYQKMKYDLKKVVARLKKRDLLSKR